MRSKITNEWGELYNKRKREKERKDEIKCEGKKEERDKNGAQLKAFRYMLC
jgi:hypothetical protein